MQKQIHTLAQELLLDAPLIIACLFAGAALYISELDPRVRALLINKKQQLTHWSCVCNLGIAVMPLIAMIGSVTAVAAYYHTKENAYLWGAGTFISVLPYTLAFIVPLNRSLEGILAATQGPEIDESQKENVMNGMKKWVGLHRLRPLLALIASGIFFVAKHHAKA